MKKQLTLIWGFLFGVLYVVGCGGGAQSIAQAVADALDLPYDNSESRLLATNVQDAIDQVADEAGVTTSESLTGDWSGYKNSSAGQEPASLVLSPDGSASCDFEARICDGVQTWELFGKTIKLNYEAVSGGSTSTLTKTAVTTIELSAHLPIIYASETEMQVIAGSDPNGGMIVLNLSK